MNYRIIIHTLGWVLIFEAICMLISLVCGLFFGESVTAMAISIGICLILGLGAIFRAPKNRAMYAKEGFITVALSWIVMSIFGALPFYISGEIPNFIDALFETVSGFSTTGASILSDVEALPKNLLFWRSFTHWIGGMGVLVLIVAILPLSGGSNLHLIKAESPGPSVSKLVPKIRSTAKILYGIYTVMTALQVILLLFGGMNLFEALTISLGTAGTGGFALRNSGAAEYTPYMQYVITVFMILFGINFSLYYLILIRRAKEAFRSSELRTYLLVILGAICIITLNTRGMYSSLEEGIRHSAFQVGSIITTTGFSTVDFNNWPELSKTVLVLLMFMGACAGSTGGGIKVSRIMLLIKSIFKELRITAHPRSTYKTTMDGRIVSHETVRSINVFLAAYLVIYAISLLLISINGLDFTSNFTAVAATINNIGPGLSQVGPYENFSVYSGFSKIVFIFDMLIGRLEIFPMLILFSPETWKK